MFVRDDNPGAAEPELLARDRLAHELMYFSRGNPVVYYGDEQGFTGAGGDQDARQDMFPSQSKQYNNLSTPDEPVNKFGGDDGAGKNDNIGSDETPMDDNFDTGHPLYRKIRKLATLTQRPSRAARRRPAAPVLLVVGGRLRVLAHQPLAQARVRRRAQQRGAGRRRRRSRPSWRTASGRRSTATARSGCAPAPRRPLDVTLPPLSTVVYRAKKHIPRSKAAPRLTVDREAAVPRPARGRARTSTAARSTR